VSKSGCLVRVLTFSLQQALQPPVASSPEVQALLHLFNEQQIQIQALTAALANTSPLQGKRKTDDEEDVPARKTKKAKSRQRPRVQAGQEEARHVSSNPQEAQGPGSQGCPQA